MLYLALSIIGAIILVAIAVRRLPYLRAPRLGLEIAHPKPYIMRSSPWNTVRQHITLFIQKIFSRPRIALPVDASELPAHIMPSAYSVNPAAVSVGVSRTTQETSLQTEADELSQTAHPGDFWHENPTQAAMPPLSLPTKGLITRRSESQKIAQELIAQADEAFRKKDWPKAENYYLQAATKDPDNARIYNRLGVIYLQTKNYKDAIDAFRGAIRFDDRIASRHYNLALAYLGKRDYRSAERGLHEAIRLDPTNEKYRKTLQAIERQPA